MTCGEREGKPIKSPIKALAMGETNTCVIDRDNLVSCWVPQSKPGYCGLRSFADLGEVSHLQASDKIVCAQRAGTDHIVCKSFQSGITQEASVEVFSGNYGFCGITGKDIICWGEPGEQLVRLPANASPKSIVSRFRNTCAIDDKKNLWCWGANADGQIDSPEKFIKTPQMFANMNVEVVAIGTHAIHLWTTHKEIFSWGMQPENVSDTAPQPVKRTSTADLIQLVAGKSHACYLTASGEVYCWGSNIRGQIGVVSEVPFFSQPTLVEGLKNVAQIATGADHSCALKSNGTVWCWGGNHHNQIGGSADMIEAPVMVIGCQNQPYEEWQTPLY